MGEKPQIKWEFILVATDIKFRNKRITQYKSIVQLFCDSGVKKNSGNGNGQNKSLFIASAYNKKTSSV